MMEQGLVLGVVGLTTVAACLVGIKKLGLPVNGIGRALRRMLEGIGIVLIFLGANVAAGVIMVLITRALTGNFVSLYLVTDVTLLPLSLFQGLAFQWWWDRGGGSAVRPGGERGPE
jgi:hypothetical protein